MVTHKILLMSVIVALTTQGCIHPKVGLRKSRLVDPMMDPATAADFGATALSSVQGTYERAMIGGGGSSGGSCPTCK